MEESTEIGKHYFGYRILVLKGTERLGMKGLKEDTDDSTGDTSDGLANDLLANAPLEAAYAWSLLCRFRQERSISFSDYRINFRSEDFCIGRLFPSSSSSKGGPMINPRKLKKNTMYVALEEYLERDVIHRNGSY